MFGRKENVNQRPEQVCLSIFLTSPTYMKYYQARQMANSTMVGTGFAMEGRKPSWVYNKAFSLLMLNIRDPQQLCNVRVAERDVLEAGEFEWLLVDERTFLTYDC